MSKQMHQRIEDLDIQRKIGRKTYEAIESGSRTNNWVVGLTHREARLQWLLAEQRYQHAILRFRKDRH